MILQTGGSPLGATSTRSSPASLARRLASSTSTTPTGLSFSSIRRTGEIRIRSLMRSRLPVSRGWGRERPLAMGRAFRWGNRRSVARRRAGPSCGCYVGLNGKRSRSTAGSGRTNDIPAGRGLDITAYRLSLQGPVSKNRPCEIRNLCVRNRGGKARPLNPPYQNCRTSISSQ